MKKVIISACVALTLAACGGGSTPATTTPATTSTSVSGSAIKGPIIGGAVRVVDANGNAVITSPAKPLTDAQAQFNFTVPSGTATPLVITVSGGTDSITGAAPDLPLTTAITTLPFNGSASGTVSPLSTLAVATAQALGGGSLTVADLTTAANSVSAAMNFGLSTGVDPFTIIDNTNIAQILKANEAAAEMMRRTATATGGTLASTLSDLANDLTTGAIDGNVAVGVTASPQAVQNAAVALTQQAIVLIVA